MLRTLFVKKKWSVKLCVTYRDNNGQIKVIYPTKEIYASDAETAKNMAALQYPQVISVRGMSAQCLD